MQQLEDFELQPLHKGLLETPRHELLCQGKPTGFFCEASDVVAQYQWGDYFLMATVRENPKQEKLECYLLDQRFKQKAYCQYSGWTTTSFMVTGQQLLAEDSLEIQLNKIIRIQIDIVKKRWPWPRAILNLQPQLQ